MGGNSHHFTLQCHASRRLIFISIPTSHASFVAVIYQIYFQLTFIYYSLNFKLQIVLIFLDTYRLLGIQIYRTSKYITKIIYLEKKHGQQFNLGKYGLPCNMTPCVGCYLATRLLNKSKLASNRLQDLSQSSSGDRQIRSG